MKVKVRVPATSANLGPGFDALGIALELYNYVEMREGPPGVMVETYGEGAGELPAGEDNLVYRAAAEVFRMAGLRLPGLHLRLENHIPLCRGLGSSAAAIVGGMLAANRMAGNPLTPQEILSLAADMEGHPDNVTAALSGGITISCLHQERVVYARIPPPRNLQAVIAVPFFPLSTRLAREILPSEVPMGDAIFNIQRTSLLVAALCTGNLELLEVAMTDRIHQPYRQGLVPGLLEAIDSARAAGALGVTLSGAGPSVVAWVAGDTEPVRAALEMAMKESRILVCDLAAEGATVEESYQEEMV